MSNWFHEHGIEFTVYQWLPQSPDRNPIENLLGCAGMDDWELADAFMSTLTKISEECFQHLIGFMS